MGLFDRAKQMVAEWGDSTSTVALEPDAQSSDAPSNPTVLLGDPKHSAQVYGRASCSVCGRARRLLDDQGIDYVYTDLNDASHGMLAQMLINETGQHTVPYVFVRGGFVGGFDALSELARLGQLQNMPEDSVRVMTPEKQQGTAVAPLELTEKLADEGPNSDPRKRPIRPETHKPASPAKVIELGFAVEESMHEIQADSVTADILETVADEQGVPISQVYAGAGSMTQLKFERRNDVLFQVCTGHCQGWGALESLEHLDTLRLQQENKGGAGFDIHPMECLDRCAHAPAVIVSAPDGVAALDQADDNQLTAAVEQLCNRVP